MKTAQLIKKSQKGFTLIELLVVIGILAILLAIVLIAINPARQFAQANDTKRRSDVNTILNGVNQYMADNKGALPPVADTGTAISATATQIGSGATEVNLCTDLVTKYLADLPIDPTTGTKTPASSNCKDVGATYHTGYMISTSATDNRLTVSATAQLPENAPITVTR